MSNPKKSYTVRKSTVGSPSRDQRGTKPTLKFNNQYARNIADADPATAAVYIGDEATTYGYGGAMVVAGNKLYKMGGRRSDGITANMVLNMEAYTPLTNSHDIPGVLENMPSRRMGGCAAATTDGAYLYYFGGTFKDGINNFYSNTIFRYTVAEDSWETLSQGLPWPIMASQACTIGNRIFMINGHENYRHIYSLDLYTGIFDDRGAIPGSTPGVNIIWGSPFSQPVVYNNHIYFAKGDFTGDLIEFDPVENTFTEHSGVWGEETQGAFSARFGKHHMVIGGGRDPDFVASDQIHFVDLRDFSTHASTLTIPTGAEGEGARFWAACASGPNFDEVYFTGGWSNTGSLAQTHEFDRFLVITSGSNPFA